MSRKARNLTWSVPLVAVLAVAGALALFVALSPDAVFAVHDELPGSVTGLKAEADGRSMMDLSWNAPTTGGTATNYRIDRSDDTYTWKALTVTTDAATTHTDTGLKPARTYYYRVFAVNSSGSGPVSVEENYAFDTTASVEAPGTLRLVSAIAKSDKQIDLMWNAPSEKGGASITSYCIVAASSRVAYMAPTCTSGTLATDADGLTAINTALTAAGADTFQTIVVDAADGTKYEHKGLDASITVHYWVHAVNSAGLAPVASNPASATTKSEPTLGPAPRNLRGVANTVLFDNNGDVNGGIVNLYWNIPAGTAPQATSAYIVEYSFNGRDGWTSAGNDVPHSDAFNGEATADLPQATHMADAVTDLGSRKALYYHVKVENSRWSSATKVNLVENRARPDSLALADGGIAKAAADVTLKASTNEYLTRIDLKWAFEADDFALVPAVAAIPATNGNAAVPAVPAVPGSPHPTGYLIDYYIESSTDTDPPANIYWRPLQSNTGYARGTYNHLRGLKPTRRCTTGCSRGTRTITAFRPLRWARPKPRSRRTRSAGCGPWPTDRRRSSSTGMPCLRTATAEAPSRTMPSRFITISPIARPAMLQVG